MDKDKLKDLFTDFEPELSSDLDFLAKVHRNVNTIELVRQHNKVMRRRNKIAVVIAALSGFITGTLFTLLLPLIVDWIYTIQLPIIVDYQLVTWVISAVVSILTAVSVYEMALSGLFYPKKINANIESGH